MPGNSKFPQSLPAGNDMTGRLDLVDAVLLEFASAVHQAEADIDEEMLRNFLAIVRMLTSLREDLAIADDPHSHLIICKVRGLIRILRILAGERVVSTTIH